MTGIFKANNPFNPFLLFIYGLILKSAWILYPPVFKTDTSAGFLFKVIAEQLLKLTTNHLFYIAIGYILVYVQAMMFNRLLNNLRMWPKPNYLPAMSYLLISSLLPDWNIFSSSILMNSLLIWALSKFFKLYNTSKPKSLVFDIGLIIGFMSLLHFPAILLVVFMLVALGILRSFNIQEWIIGLVGVVTPYYFLAAILYLNNNISAFRFPTLFKNLPLYHTDSLHMAAYGMIIFLFVIGLFFVQTNMNKFVVQVRKNWGVIFLLTIFSVIVSIAGSRPVFQYFLMLLLPLSAYLAASFFYIKKRIIAELLHLGLAGLIIYCGYFLK